MGQKDVIVEKSGQIGFLILNHPEMGNLLNEKLFSTISKTLVELDGNDEIRVIIV